MLVLWVRSVRIWSGGGCATRVLDASQVETVDSSGICTLSGLPSEHVGVLRRVQAFRRGPGHRPTRRC